MLHAISVNKGCCRYQPFTLLPLIMSPEGIQDGDKLAASCPAPSHCCHLEWGTLRGPQVGKNQNTGPR